MDQNAGKTQLLFHATRKGSGQPINKRQKIGKAQIPLSPFPPLGPKDAKNIHEKIDIFPCSQILVKSETLRHITDQGLDPRFLTRHIKAIYHDFSGGWLDHGCHHPKQR
ncbi:hypothetical protein ES703_56663 [subsurface metagenome]